MARRAVCSLSLDTVTAAIMAWGLQQAGCSVEHPILLDICHRNSHHDHGLYLYIVLSMHSQIRCLWCISSRKNLGFCFAMQMLLPQAFSAHRAQAVSATPSGIISACLALQKQLTPAAAPAPAALSRRQQQPPQPPPPAAPASAVVTVVQAYGQCGGQGNGCGSIDKPCVDGVYPGHACQSDATCQCLSKWYWQVCEAPPLPGPTFEWHLYAHSWDYCAMPPSCS